MWCQHEGKPIWRSGEMKPTDVQLRPCAWLQMLPVVLTCCAVVTSHLQKERPRISVLIALLTLSKAELSQFFHV